MIVAVVPAAGRGTRMGRPKPLLDFGGRALISRVVGTLREGGTALVVVVAPPVDRPESEAIVREAEAAGAVVTTLPGETPEMRATIEAGLRRVVAEAPGFSGWLLTPADQPGIDTELVARVIAAGRDAEGMIVVPRAGAKRGHPVFLPRGLARAVFDLPPGVGVNALLDDPARGVIAVEVADPDRFADCDTPADYDRWLARLGLVAIDPTRPLPAGPGTG